MPGYFSELIFIDLTKKLVGGILKEVEMPDSVGRLHISAIKPSNALRTYGRLYFLTLSIF